MIKWTQGFFIFERRYVRRSTDPYVIPVCCVCVCMRMCGAEVDYVLDVFQIRVLAKRKNFNELGTLLHKPQGKVLLVLWNLDLTSLGT